MGVVAKFAYTKKIACLAASFFCVRKFCNNLSNKYLIIYTRTLIIQKFFWSIKDMFVSEIIFVYVNWVAELHTIF